MARFFISYNSADEAWADWIAGVLRELGHETRHQAADFAAGDNFVQKIDEALKWADVVVVLLSSTYVESNWCTQEWGEAVRRDAEGDDYRILPLRIKEVRPDGLLGARVYVDLVGLGQEECAEHLRDALEPGSAPTGPAPFPGDAFPGASRLYNVPDATPTFVGREDEIEELRKRLVAHDAVSVAAAVEGLAGVGKTELVIQAVRRFAGEGLFPGGIYWLNAEDPDLVPQWSGTLARRLGVGGESSAEIAQAVVNHLSKGPHPTLIVLDNVLSWSRDERPRPLPEGRHVARVVTTRRKNLRGHRGVSIRFLPEPAARDLVRQIVDRPVEEEDGFNDLLDFLAGHALSLELAAAYLREFEVSPQDYLDQLEAGGAPEADAAEFVRYEKTAEQIFQNLWDRLDTETRNAWMTASCCAPEPVSRTFSEAIGLEPRALQKLRKFHLVDTVGAGSWRMHRLTSTFASGQPEADAHRGAFVASVAKHSRSIELSTGFLVYVPDRPQFDEAVALGRTLNPPPDELSLLQDRVATAQQSLGELQSAKGLMAEALASDLKNLGSDHPEVAIRRSNLAIVLQGLGDLAGAKELLEFALASGLKSLGEDHPEVATRRSNLALVLQGLGDLAGARELLELALASDLKSLGEDHPEVATRRSNLATVLRGLGDLAGAKELHELGLASGLKSLGEDHPKVASHRSNLALVLRDLGDLAGARELLELALASGLKSLGEDHPGVAIRRSNLALVLQGLGDLAGAKVLLETALASGLKSFGEDHPEVAILSSNLATVLQGLGDLAGAKELLETALASHLKSFGEDHPKIAIRRSNLASVLQGLGDLAGARSQAEEALRICAGLPAGSYVRTGAEPVCKQILGE